MTRKAVKHGLISNGAIQTAFKSSGDCYIVKGRAIRKVAFKNALTDKLVSAMSNVTLPNGDRLANLYDYVSVDPTTGAVEISMDAFLQWTRANRPEFIWAIPKNESAAEQEVNETLAEEGVDADSTDPELIAQVEAELADAGRIQVADPVNVVQAWIDRYLKDVKLKITDVKQDDKDTVLVEGRWLGDLVDAQSVSQPSWRSMSSHQRQKRMAKTLKTQLVQRMSGVKVQDIPVQEMVTQLENFRTVTRNYFPKYFTTLTQSERIDAMFEDLIDTIRNFADF